MKQYFKKFAHTCDLKSDDAPVADKRNWLHKKMVEWSTIDLTSNLTLQHFNSFSTAVSAKQKHLKEHPLTIHPFSRIKMAWELVIIITFLTALVYVPLQYLDYADADIGNNVGSLLVMKVTKTFAIVDMVFQFFSGYWDQRNFKIVLCKKRIARKYLRGLFIFDFLTNIPFFIGLGLHIETNDLRFHTVKTLTLFRIVRLPTTVRFCERMFLRLGVEDKYLGIFKMLLYWILCIHWIACLHILPGSIVSGFSDIKVGAWYETREFQKHEWIDKYVICLFKSVKTIMGTGYVNELQPKTSFDKAYALIITIAGRVGLCITMAYIFEILQGVRSAKLRFDEMMVQLHNYTDQNGLPQSTKAKMKNNYDYMFRKRYFNEREILKTVSSPLRQQIMIHNTRQLVDNSPFFENLPSSLVLKIISALSVELFLDGDVIYTMGQLGMSVYFITSGSVALYTPSGKEVCHLSDGDYFGEMTLVSDGLAEHHYTRAVALETTECYKLGKHDFQKLIQSYPDLLQKVEALVMERIESVLMIEEREKHRKPFQYESINQHSADRRSTDF